MKRNVRIAVCFMLCMLLAAVSGSKVQAATGINVEYHTQDEIRQMTEMLNIQKNMETAYSEMPVNTQPYNPGKLAETTVQNGLNTLNLIRYVAGIPYDVKNSEAYEKKAQAAALVNWVNGAMSHYPAQPEGMDGALYQVGAEGARSSNLGMGYGNLYQTITGGWMADDDNGNIDRVGHRRWCLNPGMEYTGFGIAGRNYAMYAFDGGFSNKGYYGVAWPAQNMPVELFENSWYSTMPWSISMGKTVNPGSVRVTLTRESDGRVWNFSESGADGDFFVNNAGYGQPGCIIFRPAGIQEYKSGDSFHVEIEGLGAPVSYDVDFFSMHEHQGGNATCEKKAVCNICGKEYGELGEHAWGSWKTDRNGTYDKEGVESRSCTNCRKKETRTLPMIPKLKKVISAREDSLTVTWNKVTGADGYRIYFKTGRSWKYLAEVEGNVSSYKHQGLSSGTAYTYTVRAYKNRESKKIYSSYNKTGITGITVLPTPQLRNIKAYSTCIKLTWKKVSGASGYLVYRKTDNGGWKRVAVMNGSTIGYTDRNVKKGTVYTYTVKAYKRVSGKNIYSKYDKDGKSVANPLDIKDYVNSYPSTLARYGSSC